jgi:hypothetical protein
MSGNTMQLIISPANENFGKLLGLRSGTYPATVQTVVTSQMSNVTVEGSPIQAINLACPGIVDNSISNTPDTFYSFVPTSTSFGSTISLTPPELLWCDIHSGRFTNLNLTIRDQLNREIEMRDSTVCIMLALRSSE